MRQIERLKEEKLRNEEKQRNGEDIKEVWVLKGGLVDNLKMRKRCRKKNWRCVVISLLSIVNRKKESKYPIIF